MWMALPARNLLIWYMVCGTSIGHSPQAARTPPPTRSTQTGRKLQTIHTYRAYSARAHTIGKNEVLGSLTCHSALMFLCCAMLCLLSHRVATTAQIARMLVTHLLSVFITPIFAVLCYTIFVLLVMLSPSLSVICSLQCEGFGLMRPI